MHHYTTDGADSTVDRRMLIIAPGNDPRKPAPLAVWLHNSGGSELNALQDPQGRIQPYVQALLDDGINIVMMNMRGSSWGNEAGRSDVVAAYEWATSLVATSKVVLTGPSMGGQVAWQILVRNEIPNVAAVLLVAPVTALQNLYQSGYKPQIDAAFNVSSFEAVPQRYKPELRAGHEFRMVPVGIITSPTDATCDIRRARELVAKVQQYAPSSFLHESTGDHMAASQFTDAIAVGLPWLRAQLA